MAATSLNQSTPTIKLHRFVVSGHAHRVELFLSLLAVPVEIIDVDITKGEHKSAEFLRLNAFGQVPVLRDGDVTIADSNAILVYLAKKYGAKDWLPEDPVGAAAVQRWLSVAAGMLAFGPARARRIAIFKAKADPSEAIALANTLFAVMDAELQRSAFLIGAKPTIADLANYTYTAHADEGGISLQPYPNVRSWLQRIESLAGFISMQKTSISA